MSSSTKSAFTGRYESIPGLYTTTDLSAAQFKAVSLMSTGGQIKLVGTSIVTALVVGILMDAPKGTATLPQNAEVAVQGIVKAIVGTSIVKKGDNLGTNTTSQLVPTTTDNRWVVAKALGASSAVGDIIPVLLLDGGQRY